MRLLIMSKLEILDLNQNNHIQNKFPQSFDIGPCCLQIYVEYSK